MNRSSPYLKKYLSSAHAGDPSRFLSALGSGWTVGSALRRSSEIMVSASSATLHTQVSVGSTLRSSSRSFSSVASKRAVSCALDARRSVSGCLRADFTLAGLGGVRLGELLADRLVHLIGRA
ncbi:hypothetical protein BRADI_1g08703v3 [Brachypodium distachyon]|uniref:Uncharacterized protein n=1 Tax=Brachypodium distachyon TaxID=15368 RepID=A0A2K2DIP2_BRADI|nr:hypothetical protein BRADI_1g08703v3 [Brachypodium distachyon]